MPAQETHKVDELTGVRTSMGVNKGAVCKLSMEVILGARPGTQTRLCMVFSNGTQSTQPLPVLGGASCMHSM